MPSNPFAAERERRQGGNPFTAEKAKRETGVGMAFGQSAFNRYVNNVLSSLSAANAALFPASSLNVRPPPTIQDIGAGTRSIPSLMPGGETPGEAFARNRQQIAADEAAVREAHPVASGAGDITGDIATLITGRAPVANLIRRLELKLNPRTADMFFGKAPRVLEPGIRRTVDKALNSPSLRRLARGAGRTIETGLEGAVLEVLKGDDPLEAAAFAASGQAFGSAFLQGSQGILSGGYKSAGLKVGITAAAIASLWQLGKSATPGGRDFVLESIETGFDKVKYGIALGALSAIGGAGRGRSGLRAEDMPKIMDFIATIPRGFSLSLITDIAKMDPEEQAKAENALNNLARDPDYEGRDEIERRIIERLKQIDE